MLEKTYPRRHPIEPPHALLPSACSQTETLSPCPQSTYHIPQTKQKQNAKRQTPNANKKHKKQIFLGFLFSQKQTAKASAEQNKTPITNTERNFFWGFLSSQKQTAKASTEQNKTSKKADPKSNKNNMRKGGRRKKEEASQSRRSEDTEDGPSAAA